MHCICKICRWILKPYEIVILWPFAIVGPTKFVATLRLNTNEVDIQKPMHKIMHRPSSLNFICIRCAPNIHYTFAITPMNTEVCAVPSPTITWGIGVCCGAIEGHIPLAITTRTTTLLCLVIQKTYSTYSCYIIRAGQSEIASSL